PWSGGRADGPERHDQQRRERRALDAGRGELLHGVYWPTVTAWPPVRFPGTVTTGSPRLSPATISTSEPRRRPVVTRTSAVLPWRTTSTFSTPAKTMSAVDGTVTTGWLTSVMISTRAKAP